MNQAHLKDEAAIPFFFFQFSHNPRNGLPALCSMKISVTLSGVSLLFIQ